MKKILISLVTLLCVCMVLFGVSCSKKGNESPSSSDGIQSEERREDNADSTEENENKSEGKEDDSSSDSDSVPDSGSDSVSDGKTNETPRVPID